MTREARRWIAGGAVAAALLAVAVLALRPHGVPGDAAGGAPPSVPLATARYGDFVERVDAQGRVGPPAGSSAKIAFAEAGIVRSVDVRVGDAVRRGEPLAELDRAALSAALAAARADAGVASASYGGGAAPAASVRSAAARLAVALERLATMQSGGPAALEGPIAAQAAARQAALKVAADAAEVTREQQLFTAGVAAAKDVDAARSQLAGDEADQRAADARAAAAGTDFAAALEQAQADVATARSDLEAARAQRGVLGGEAASAQARLDAARIAYGNGVLTAPADVVVLAILKHPGEAVDPTVPAIEVGPAFGAGATLLVPGDVARRIAAGDAVTLHAGSDAGGATNGSVTAVVPAVDPASQLATVTVSGAPPGALAGDAIEASIVVGHVAGVIVPSSAIVQDPQSGRTVVFVRRPHPAAGEPGFVMRTVVVRASDATSASIAAGLGPGEQVAAQGGYTLLAPMGD
jgi:multidrug efflux pump subunit AcrA (membrane-fusion protein)